MKATFTLVTVTGATSPPQVVIPVCANAETKPQDRPTLRLVRSSD